MSLTKEQLFERTKTLGASEIAAVVGLNPYQSAHDIWLKKLGLVYEEENHATRVGNLIEPLVLQLYKEDEGVDVEYRGTIIHPTKAWVSATPDGFVVGRPRLVEVKCVGFRVLHQWGTEADAVPDFYRTQAEWQSLVTGATEVDFAALLGGTEFRIYRVTSDPELGAMLLDQGERFWRDHVLTGKPPAADHSDGARRMLSALYPANRKPLLRSTPESEAAARDLFAAKNAFEDAERWKQRAENRMRELIADADGIKGDGFVATYKCDKNGRRNLRVTAKEAA